MITERDFGSNDSTKMNKKGTCKPILTVAIPTYNRSHTLEKVLRQLRQEENQCFRIIVSDNHSSDDTVIMIRRYQKNMRDLDYSRNKENIGYAGNILKLYELVKTPYIWFLSDDETIIPGAMDKILRAIERYRPTVATFSHTYIDLFGRNMITGVKEDRVYSNLSKFNNYQSLLKTIFLSGLVIKKEGSIDVIRTADYSNNIFIQLTLSLLLLSRRFYFCEITSVIVHRNTSYKFGEFFKFCLTDVWDAIFMVEHKFDNKKFVKLCKTEIVPTFLLYLSQKLGLFKSNGKPTKETLRKIVKYYGFYSFFLLFLPIFYVIIPAVSLKLVYFISLFKMYGYREARAIYKQNINRAFADKRETGFTAYR